MNSPEKAHPRKKGTGGRRRIVAETKKREKIDSDEKEVEE